MTRRLIWHVVNITWAQLKGAVQNWVHWKGVVEALCSLMSNKEETKVNKTNMILMQLLEKLNDFYKG